MIDRLIHHPHRPAAPPTEPTAHRAHPPPRARQSRSTPNQPRTPFIEWVRRQNLPARLLSIEYGWTLPRAPTCMVCHPPAGAKRCFFGHDSPEAFSSGFYLKSRFMISHDSPEASSTMKLKYRRRRPEGGEWEPIKITHSNLAYIPNFKNRHTLNPVFSPGKIQRVLSLGKIGQNGQVLSPGKIRLVKSDKTDKFSVLVKSDW
jgi:hypothetical protein